MDYTLLRWLAAPNEPRKPRWWLELGCRDLIVGSLGFIGTGKPFSGTNETEIDIPYTTLCESVLFASSVAVAWAHGR